MCHDTARGQIASHVRGRVMSSQRGRFVFANPLLAVGLLPDCAVPTETASAPAREDGFHDTGIRPLWDVTRGDPRVLIAVLDGPIDVEHPAFRGARLETPKTNVTPGPALAHGTYVASLLFGQGAGGVQGIAPNCRGLSIPIFQDSADGQSIEPCPQSDLARAIDVAVAAGAHVINLSGGQFETAADPRLEQSVRRCAEQGVLLVAAAGNDGCDCLHLPAALPSVLVVGAMDDEGQPRDYSNWGAAYRDRGVLAADQALGAAPGGAAVRRRGTSSATPIVAGVAGLLLSLQLQLGRPVDTDAVRRAILSSAINCSEQPAADCRQVLAGRLNISGALSLLVKGAAVTETTPALAAVRSSEPRTEPSSTTPAGSPAGGASVVPSSCGCGGGAAPSFAYALGLVGIDYGSESRREGLMQTGLSDPNSHAAVIAHLGQQPWNAESLVWTLCQETTPIYAIQPAGAYAREGYERLTRFLREQAEEGVTQVSVPGRLMGKTRLMNGQTVPLLVPELRGMFSWSTPALVNHVLGQASSQPTPEQAAERERQTAAITNFLERVYHELRNFGVSSQERALNFAATNAFQWGEVFAAAIQAELSLDGITIDRSPLCRPGTDCWDVVATFFSPQHRRDQARTVFRFTVDVSDIVPVSIGKIRKWQVF